MKSSLKFIATTFALSIVFTSCKKEEEEAVVSDSPKEIVLPRVQQIPTGNYTAPQIQPQQQQQVTQNNQQVAQAPVVTKPGMNPPHGQSGHRCDIQVGAPLNSKPTPPPAQAGTTTSKQITMPASSSSPNNTPAILQPNKTTTVTAPGMNPPHGQEGHRCDVAVGAALPKE